MFKLQQLVLGDAGGLTSSNNYYDWGTQSDGNDRIGNISVLGDKYNLEHITMVGERSIIGQIKDLKNLKKLYYVDFSNGSVTGSKTDLYNNGVNITTFYI